MLERAKEVLSGLAGREVLAAVSGGMDSMCLLQLLHSWGGVRGIRVTAAHFNHQLRQEEADRDEAFVRGWCAERGIPVVCGRGDVRALAEERGLSIEEAAREARYAFLREAAGETSPILTAHHADDNAETMLLNLLRGTGLRGLTGIPAQRQGIVRPFLEIPRTELAVYAAEQSLVWVEDSTNAQEDAARNVLRHRVLPVLRELNPRAVENMTRTALLLERDEAALTRGAQELLSRCYPMERGLGISAADCLRADDAVRSRCVLELLSRVGGHRKDLSAAHVEAVCGLLQGPPGREVRLPYGVIARQDGRNLLVQRSEESPEAAVLTIGETVFFGRWQVCLSADSGAWVLSVPAGAELTVTPWSRDDGMTLPGSRGRRSLKRLCADAGISPEQRDRLPVLRVNGQCAVVPGIGMDQDFASGSHPETVFVTFYQHYIETEENRHGA
ncbi:MAG: tRNA lysidine(34) synthetase TilS [Ruminococcaceae bacterium]|nr:tRNA lysidine(34) synthetase TilS [Oscillospiraceae bacterium]